MKYFQRPFRYMLLFSVFMLVAINADAQVVIGEGDQQKPVVQAILDIKQKSGKGVNADKGVIFPRVELTAPNTLTIVDAPSAADKTSHKGAIVYNPTGTTTMPVGLYVWDGAKWNLLQSLSSSACVTCVETVGYLKEITTKKDETIGVDFSVQVSGKIADLPAGIVVGYLNGLKVTTKGVGSSGTEINLNISGKTESEYPFFIPINIPGFEDCTLCPVFINIPPAGGSGASEITGEVDACPANFAAGKLGTVKLNVPFTLPAVDMYVKNFSEEVVLTVGDLIGYNDEVFLTVKSPVTIPKGSSSATKISVEIHGVVTRVNSYDRVNLPINSMRKKEVGAVDRTVTMKQCSVLPYVAIEK